MPRVENTGDNVSQYCEESGEGSSTFDICGGCEIDLIGDETCFVGILKPYNGDPIGHDGHSSGADHPPYSECDYTCDVCNNPLKDEDN